jgi:hypothetical protein
MPSLGDIKLRFHSRIGCTGGDGNRFPGSCIVGNLNIVRGGIIRAPIHGNASQRRNGTEVQIHAFLGIASDCVNIPSIPGLAQEDVTRNHECEHDNDRNRNNSE